MNEKTVELNLGIYNLDSCLDPDELEPAVCALASALDEMEWCTWEDNEIIIDEVPVRLGFAGGNDYWFVIGDERHTYMCATHEELANIVLVQLHEYMNANKDH